MGRLASWIKSLPNPIGIIAVTTDARARHLLRVSLSSVAQGCKAIGYSAARMMHRQLLEKNGGNRKKHSKEQVLVPPTVVYERQSSDFRVTGDPYVIQALNFIRNNAHKGIKVGQVPVYVGVSRSNLDERFCHERGHSIHQGIFGTKLSSAVGLLLKTNLLIAEVSKNYGYTSTQYFYSVFKKAFSKNLKEYRETELSTEQERRLSQKNNV